MSDGRYDAVIVGYGPTGEMAANLLGGYGMKVAVFESATGVYNMPRAVHFDSEIMRCFQSTGLADAVLPSTTKLRGMHFVTAGGEKLFGYDMPERPTPNGWHADYLFYQPELEAALQEGVRRYPKVDVFPGHEVLAIDQDDDSVRVQAREIATGVEREAVADYLLGCDGARSVTRRAAGLELEDLEFDQPWLVVDVMLKRPVELSETALQICDPNRPTTFVPSRGNHRRWELMLMPGDSPDEVTRPERVWELLAPWLTPDDAELTRAVVYAFHALIARRWRERRIFLAGDSAHQMPPFLGQGMCSGIRDMVNLAWKLDLVRRGVAGDALLDTYEEERSPHVRAIIERAVQLGGIIQTTDPAVAAKRDAGFLEASRTGDARPFAPAMPSLRSGFLDGDCGERTGRLFPQGLVRTPDGEARLDDLIGPRFAVVAPSALAGGCSFDGWPDVPVALVAIGDRAPEGWLQATDTTGVLEKVLGHGIAVVRPDRIVYGTTSDGPGLAKLLSSLGSRLHAGA